MKILPRYIIKEHIAPFFFALAVLMFIFLMNFLVKYITQIFGKGLSVITIIELIYYNLAWMFALAVPMAVLIATLMSFGRFSGDNEITILKSSGISIYRIIRPAIWFGIVITVLMILFNDLILPDYNHRARVMFRNIREKRPTLKLEAGIFYNVGKYSFMVEKIEKSLGDELYEKSNITGPEIDEETKPDKLLNVLIFDRTQYDKTISITAKEGYMVYSVPRKSIIFSLFEGEYHEFDNKNTEEYRFSNFHRNEVYINAPEFELGTKDDDHRGDHEMNVKMMVDKVQKYEMQIVNSIDKIKTITNKHWNKIFTSIDSISPDPTGESGNSFLWNSLQHNKYKRGVEKAHRNIIRLYQQIKTNESRINSHRTSVNRYKVEIHKKFSIPFSAIIFILIGAPLGITTKKGSLGVGASLSIFFFLIYWAGLILGEDLADRKLISPFIAMWLPNILIGIAGMLLILRAIKESSIIKIDVIKNLFKNRKSEGNEIT